MEIFDYTMSAELFSERKHAPLHIEGIRCDVKSCAFHDGDSYCCASRVNIGSNYSKLTNETVYATYKKKFL